MKKQNLTKDELQKQLNKIAKQEELELIVKHYPEFKKLVGKYFKIRNSYGHGSSWWLYTKITEINPSDVYEGANKQALCHYKGWSFQTCDKYGNISVEQVKHGYCHSLGKEITEEEFNSAWNKMIEKLNNL